MATLNNVLSTGARTGIILSILAPSKTHPLINGKKEKYMSTFNRINNLVNI